MIPVMFFFVNLRILTGNMQCLSSWVCWETHGGDGGWFQVGGRWEVNDLEIRTSWKKIGRSKQNLVNLCKESCCLRKECSFPKFGSFLTISVFLLEPLLCIVFCFLTFSWTEMMDKFHIRAVFLGKFG